VIDAIGHPADHNCGGVHTCTPEPDTAMLAVPIGGQRVEVCDTVDAASGMLEIDFLVTDTGILGRRHVAADGAGAAQPLRVQGPATGRPYGFSAAERAQAVEAADVASLLATRLFRRL